MSQMIELTVEERNLLRTALSGPLRDLADGQLDICLRLHARQLLRRAGSASLMNGWRGSPRAFVLTQVGWNVLKAERAAPRRSIARAS